MHGSSVAGAVGAASSDLKALSQGDSLARLTGNELILLASQTKAADVVVVQEPFIVEVPVPISVPSPAVIPSLVSTAPATMAATVSAPAPAQPKRVQEEQQEEDIPYETVREEIARLNATVAELNETNDRIMAQNIALLSDLEAAQKAVRELRSEKDSLALQLKSRLA
jgi:septal ring factor EnvC (AmiA/AmiB activator)